MSTNLNSIYSSFINNISSTHVSSTKRAEINSKDALFATQLENAKKTDTNSYVREIENCYPGTTVTVKSMTSNDVKNYYEEWKKQPINYSGFSHDIIVSPKVLKRMESDPIYAENMLKKIQRAATPEGFGNATIYEYKVIVRDDGEIETLACADFMNGKKQKIENNDEDKKKDEKKKLELIYSNRRIYDQWESQTLLEEKFKFTQLIEPQYLFHTGVANKIRNKVIDLM